jgi:hypothetical protein
MRASRGGDVRDWEKQEQVGLMGFFFESSPRS